MSGRPKLLIILVLMMSLAIVFPPRAHAALSVTISPPSQTAPQGTQASYTVSFSGGLLGATYVFSLSGMSGYASYYFSPTQVSAISGSSTLVISTTQVPGTYCPGAYSFTVSVTNAGAPGDTGSASGSLYVTQVGPPLVVGVSTDKSSYVKGDKITIQVTVNKPAEGTITVTPPSGSPRTYTFQTYSATSLTRTLTASEPYGTYTVSVYADDYCNYFNSATSSYSVGPNTYSVSVQLSGVPQQYSATLQVDGQNEGTVPGSQLKTLSFPIGTTHTITVGQYVAGDTGVQYYCAQNTMSVSSSGTFTFSYQTQYQLTVATDPANVTQVSGGGWFNAGASAQTSQAPQTVSGSTGVQYLFQSWSVDGSPQTGNQISVTMNGPHTAVAKYSTQYLLTVNSPGGLGNPQGGGYYNAGSTAQFSVSSPVGYLVQQVFAGWTGDYSGTSAQASVTMNSPKTVNATWTTSNTNAYLAGGAVAVLLVIIAILATRRRGGKGATKETKPEEKPKENDEKKKGLHLGSSDAE